MIIAHEKKKENGWQAIPGWKKERSEGDCAIMRKSTRTSSAPSPGASKNIMAKRKFTRIKQCIDRLQVIPARHSHFFVQDV